LAYHVVDVMQASLETAEQGKAIVIGTTVVRPAAMPLGLRDGEIA
jgi:hypothetical protein